MSYQLLDIAKSTTFDVSLCFKLRMEKCVRMQDVGDMKAARPFPKLRFGFVWLRLMATSFARGVKFMNAMGIPRNPNS